MLWLKRNLILALGGFLALLMLAGGVYYLYTNYQKNNAVDTELQEKRAQLEQIYNDTAKPFPNQTNIAIAKTELAKIRDTIAQAKHWFSPITGSAPAGGQALSPQEFRILLVNAIYELRRRAEQQGITLPGRNYAFSFEAQGKGLTFGPGTFPALPQQLAEIYTLSSILFDAQINRLVSIRRTRISADDENNKGAPDYHDLTIQTNPVTKCTATPYIFEFQSFSPELAKIIHALQTSTNGFLLKSILVEPAGAAAPNPLAPDNPAAAAGTPSPPPTTAPGFRQTIPSKPAPADPFGKTVVDERQLRVILLVEVINCSQATTNLATALPVPSS